MHGARRGKSGRLRKTVTYTPMQYRFPDGESFKHAELKWVDYDKMSAFPVGDPDLDARLRDASARFFVALKGASFGRCDLRVDRSGTPYMLEINPNCGSTTVPRMPAAPTFAWRATRRSRRLYAPAHSRRIAATNPFNLQHDTESMLCD
jgi:D-alanine-D-alanine ligase-like ATP-grasp enzyme